MAKTTGEATKGTVPKKVRPVTARPARENGRTNPLRATGGYFKGAWQELRAVRWPNRRSTWGLTVAVLGFTAFFTVLILLVDAGLQFVFREFLLK